jgi:hypothetical protein
MEQVKTVYRIARERRRAEANPQEIEAWLTRIEEKVEGIRRLFIMNVDEIGCSDFCDRRRVKALVPPEYEGDIIPVPVDPNTKRPTMKACIAADGFGMKPFGIADRATGDKEIEYYG